MGKGDKLPDTNNSGEVLEWEYAPPPTPYDLVRDSRIMRFSRLIVHLILRPCIRGYNGLRVIHAGNVINNWPCIITPNHSSHLDTLAVFASLPLSFTNNIFVLAAKDYFFRNSVIAFIARLIANVIPVDRTGTEQRWFKLVMQKRQSGNSILMFPAGTRDSAGVKGHFKNGAVVISRKSRTPIVPALIVGTLESMPKKGIVPRRQRITVVFGEPVHYWDDNFADWDNSEVVHDLENRVLELKSLV